MRAHNFQQSVFYVVMSVYLLGCGGDEVAAFQAKDVASSAETNIAFDIPIITDTKKPEPPKADYKPCN